MGKIRKGRSERENVAVIDKVWLERTQHVLTPRDIAMLELLKVFPIMTVQHLYELTPETFTKRGKRIAPFYENTKGIQLCRDRIRRLYDHHYVNKFSPKLGLGEGTAPQYIWLDRAGYRYFELTGRPLKQLSQEYLHHNDILDVYTQLVQLERQREIEIDYLKVCYSYKPKTANIEPDIIVAFKRNGYGFTYFIEVDTGEKKESEELRKLERYRDWQLGVSWIKEEWAAIYKRRFPTIMYVFSNRNERKCNRRIKVFGEVAEEKELRSTFISTEKFMHKILSLGER